jgi:hypothetical protein
VTRRIDARGVGVEDHTAGAATTVPNDVGGADRSSRGERVVRRRRPLPGGRAVLGALLIAASAVGVTGVVLSATAAPTTSFVVAAGALEPGARFASVEDVRTAFGRATVDLPPTLAARAVPVEELDALVGQVLLAPLERGDLLVRSALVDQRADGGDDVLSFALPRTAAVAGALRPGERIDIVATYGSGTTATTDYVVRGVRLLGVSAPDVGVVGGSSELTLTVALPSPDDVLSLGHAISTADVFVVRAGTGGDGDGSTDG